MMTKSCFVIGPIGPAESDIRVEADDFINYIVGPCVEELGFDKPIRADHLAEPGWITSQIIELLQSADLVIADLTRNNANVYYELSCRHAIGKPAIHMAAKGTALSFDVADQRTIPYTMSSPLGDESHLRHAIGIGGHPANPKSRPKVNPVEHS
jgi:hypothetical protein